MLVEPGAIQPGGTVTVRGDNLGSDEEVALAVVGPAASFLGRFATDGEGHLQVSLALPAALPEGEYLLEARVGGRAVTARLVVAGGPIDDGSQGGPDQGDPLLVPLPADWNAPVPTVPAAAGAEVPARAAPTTGPDLLPFLPLVVALAIAAAGAILVARGSR